MAIFQPTTAQLEALKAIPLNKLKRPSMPVATYLQEANDLAVWCKDDHEALLAAGLPASIFEQLENGFELLKYFELHANLERKRPSPAQRYYQEKLAEARQLQLSLSHSFRYAFFHHPDLLVKARKITKRSPHSAFFQSLNDMAVFGESQLELLAAIGFNPNELAQVRQLSDELASLKASLRASTTNMRKMRDRAYFFLKAAVDELYACGRFVFRSNPARVKGYYSKYMQQKALRQKRATNKKEVTYEQ